MRIIRFCFSPTGGTRKVLEALTKQCKTNEVIDIDLCASENQPMGISKDDVCYIAMPVYGGRIPHLALSRLSTYNGFQARAVLVAVYGNRAFDDALMELKYASVSYGFRPIAAIAAIAEHSILRTIATGRPDDNDKKVLASFEEKIEEAIASGACPRDIAVPGHFPYKEYKENPCKPKAGRKCTECGTCAKACPAGAINRDNPKKTDEKACISCMRCVSVCPVQAREVSKLILLAVEKKIGEACKERKEPVLFN
jgi:ferredoxin